MEKRYLFMVALCAVKPDKRFKESVTENGKTTFLSDAGVELGYDIQTQVAVTPLSVLAPTVKMAERMALDIAREKYPFAKGWMTHIAQISLIEKKRLKGILPMIAWGEPVVDDDDAIDERTIIQRELL